MCWWWDYERFLQFLHFKSLIKQLTCLKNPGNPSCIDLILTNKTWSFHSTCVLDIGISNFHRMIVSVLKMHFRKLKVTSHRGIKKFENERFLNSLYLPLNIQNIVYNKNLDFFFNICQNELNHHPPRKEKYVRGNNKHFMTKTYCLCLSWKERVLETDFWKIRQMKID